MDEEERGERALAILPEDFEWCRVRRVRHDGEWWFAVEDVVAALTDGPEFAGAWERLKEQELAACGVDLSELCRWLEMEPVTSGHGFKVETVTLEGIFRIVQSVSSPRAEVFKRWLARVGQEREIRHGYKTGLDTIFPMLGEAAIAAIACRYQAQGLDDCRVAARKGGGIAGEARERLEQETGAGLRRGSIWLGRRARRGCKARSKRAIVLLGQ